MTDFPTIYPSSISFDHGRPQVSEYTAFGVGPIRFRNNNYVNSQTLTLEYTYIQQTEIDAIRDHYNGNQGTAGEFLVPISVLGGIGITDSTTLYRYLETPNEEHFGVYFNLTVTLQAVEGIELLFTLDGGPAVLPSEESFSKLVFDGTAPFILNGSTSALATLICNAD